MFLARLLPPSAARLRFLLLGALLAGSLRPAGLPARDVVFTPDNADILNPERGLMAYTKVDDSTLASIDQLRATGHTLMWALIDLEPWRTVDLPADRLAEIARSFARARSAGVKMVVRIFYTEDPEVADTTLVWQRRHLQQLAPTFAANNDIIVCYQAGGIGAWGEWYYSTTGLANSADRKTLLDMMFDALPVDCVIQVRTPMYKRDYADAAGTLPARVARLGHFNDCFMANDTDYGTYDTDPSIAYWKAMVAADAYSLPVGGETCALDPVNDCDAPVAEMEMLGWSFLHSGYNAAVLGKWASQGCWDEIRRRLGYRLVLRTATLPDEVMPGKPFTVRVTLENVGFAPPLHSRPVYLRMIDGARRFDWRLDTAEPRDWTPGDDQTIETTLTAPVLLGGESVTLALWLPDPAAGLAARPEYAVRFANAGTWDAAAGHNALGAPIPVKRQGTSAFLLLGDE